MRVVVALLMFGALAAFGLGMLRSLSGRRPHAHDPSDAAPPPADVRIVYRCGTCGTELLVLRQGSDAAPRHCGESMTLREEIPRA
jgi:DNA-directed RNA polymerase subunit RPC12/RpoP